MIAMVRNYTYGIIQTYEGKSEFWGFNTFIASLQVVGTDFLLCKILLYSCTEYIMQAYPISILSLSLSLSPLSLSPSLPPSPHLVEGHCLHGGIKG